VKHIERVAFKKLSGGQKQRVSIALALVGNPKIAILDELTTGLDPEARRNIWAVIERMRERGVTVILVTHFMDEAETLCDRVALINRGRLRALDTPETIAAEAGGNRWRFVPSQPVDDETLYAVHGVQVVGRKDRYVTVTGTGDLAASLVPRGLAKAKDRQESLVDAPLLFRADPADQLAESAGIDRSDLLDQHSGRLA